LNINKSEKFIKKWKKDRQEGKEKYVNKTSMQSGMLMLVATSILLINGEIGVGK
jgi:hypothetical protein